MTPCLANVIWLYYWPYHLLSSDGFYWMAGLTLLVEAAVFRLARWPWVRSLVAAGIANAASYCLGGWVVRVLRMGGGLPDNSPETFIEPVHLWAGFAVAFGLSVAIEAPMCRLVLRSVHLARVLGVVFLANLASYALLIGVNWKASNDVLWQMRTPPGLQRLLDAWDAREAGPQPSPPEGR